MNGDSKGKFWGRLAFSLNTGLALAAASTALAQTAAPTTTPPATPGTAASQTVQLEKFVVTGSNIPEAQQALAIPISVVSPSDIENSGIETNLLDVLRKVSPAVSGIGTENATVATSDTFGGSAISLYNLPTLVLINGERMAYSPSDAAGGLEFVDLNAIPLAAIERVEVVSGGESAIYGSDAIGGVINIILKKDFNGWQANTHFGESDQTGHYTEHAYSLVGGVSDGKTSVTVSAEYSENSPVFEYERPYSNPFYGTTYVPGIVEVFGLSPTSTYDEAFQLNPKYNAPPGGGTYSIQQLVSMGVYTDLGSFNSPGTLNEVEQILNLANKETLAESLKRDSATFDFEHHIYNDSLVFYGDVLYSHVQTMSELNAQPLFPYISDTNSDLGVYGVTPPQPGTEYVPIAAPTNPFSQAWMDQGSTNGSAGFGVLVHDRFETYPRFFDNDTTTTRYEAGLKGNISDDWSWHITGDLSRIEDAYTNPDLLDTNNLIAAFVAGTVNPFAYTQAPGALDGVLGTGYVNFVSTLGTVNGVVDGKILSLPAGDLDFALGGEYMRYGLSAVPDNNTANGLWIDSPTILPFDAAREVNSVYGELELPVVSPSMSVPGAYSLNLDWAERYDDYKGIGTSTVPNIQVKYNPFNDQLALRGSAGRSFIAPTLYDLYGPQTQGSSDLISYTGANGISYTNVQFQAVSGSNPKLQPSKASEWSAGFVWSPKAISNFDLTFDYYDVVQHGLVGSVDQTTIIQSVEDYGSASPYADLIHFGSATGPGISSTTPGQISSRPLSDVYIVAPLINLGAAAEKFFETSADYAIDTGVGRFELDATMEYYNSVLLQVVPTENYYQYAGTVSGNQQSVSGVGGTIPRYRTYTTIQYKLHGLDLFAANTFIPSVEDLNAGGSAASPPLHVPAYTQWDFAVGYDLGKANLASWLNGVSVRVGVNNAFDYQPPAAPYDEVDTIADISTYNGAVGRLLFVDAQVKF